MAMPTRAQLDELIRARLTDDPDFRAHLLADPRAAVSEVVGVDLPDIVEVEVHEESLTQVHIVIEASPAPGELDEDDLELVAGGGMCWDDCGGCAGTGP